MTKEKGVRFLGAVTLFVCGCLWSQHVVNSFLTRLVPVVISDSFTRQLSMFLVNC